MFASQTQRQSGILSILRHIAENLNINIDLFTEIVQKDKELDTIIHLLSRIGESFFEHLGPLVEGVVLLEPVHLTTGKLKLPISQPNPKLGSLTLNIESKSMYLFCGIVIPYIVVGVFHSKPHHLEMTSFNSVEIYEYAAFKCLTSTTQPRSM